MLINFETAKLAKEKGFDIPVICGYSTNGIITYSYHYEDYGDTKPFDWNNKAPYNGRTIISAPTQADLITWIRNHLKVNIEVRYYGYGNWRAESYRITEEDEENDFREISISDSKIPEDCLEMELQNILKNGQPNKC